MPMAPLFTTHLPQTLKASSIKVYLADVRSLHIENVFANPLSNCLRLERVIRGIKRSQGISTRERLPVTLTVLSRIRAVLNFECYDDVCFGQHVVRVFSASFDLVNSQPRTATLILEFI